MTLLRERCTYSLNATAYCVAKGIKLIRTFKEPGRNTTFVLDDGYGQASDTLREYWNGEPMVNAREYADARRYLLEVMHETTPEATNDKEKTPYAATVN